MTSFGTYFKYRFKSGLLRLIALSAIAVIFISITVGNDLSDKTYGDLYTDIPYIWYIMYVVIGLVIALPILELSPLTNRRNLDTLYTLPVNRRKMALSHLLCAWLHFVIIYTLAYGVASAIWSIHYYGVFHIGYFVPLYFIVLGLGTAFLIFYMFVFSQANTVFDGIVFMALWSFVFMFSIVAVVCLFYDLIHLSWGFFNLFDHWLEPLEEKMIPFAVLDDIQHVFRWRISACEPKIWGYPYGLQTQTVNFESTFYVAVVIWALIAIASFAGYIYFFAKKKSEKAGGMSDSPFGYKTLLPFFFCLLVAINVIILEREILLICICAVFIAYFIYRRGFRLKKSDLVSIAVSFGVGIIIAVIWICVHSSLMQNLHLC